MRYLKIYIKIFTLILFIVGFAGCLEDNNGSKTKLEIEIIPTVNEEFISSWPDSIYGTGGCRAGMLSERLTIRKSSIKGAKCGVFHEILDSIHGLKINEINVIRNLFDYSDYNGLENEVLDYLRKTERNYSGYKYFPDGSVKLYGFIKTDSIKLILKKYY